MRKKSLAEGFMIDTSDGSMGWVTDYGDNSGADPSGGPPMTGMASAPSSPSSGGGGGGGGGSGGGGGGGGGTGGSGNWNWNWGPIGTVGGLGWYQQIPPVQPVPPGFSTSNPHAYTRQAQPGELVEHRIVPLLSSTNPYIQNARQRGVEFAARRGGVNSAIAAGSAERAAIESALPIASQDAETMRRTGSENLDALNRGLFLERELANRLAVAGAGAAASMYAADVQREIAFRGFQEELRRQRERLAFEGEQRGLDRAHEMMMTNLTMNWRDLLATNDALRQEWLESARFDREIIGSVANLGARTLAEFMNNLGNAALDDPSVFDPYLVNNFAVMFSSILNNILPSVFSGLAPRPPGGG